MPAALAGWGDLAPILIFLAISAYINWKRKQGEANQGNHTPQSKPAPAGGVPARQPAPAKARQAPPDDWDDGEDIEDHDVEDWDGEHSERWDDRGGRENRSIESRSTEDRTEHLASRPAPKPSPAEAQRNLPAERGESQPAAPSKVREKAAEAGKDLLTQLAKELGLELPQPGKPAPKPAPQPAPRSGEIPSSRAPDKPPAPPPRSHSVSPDEVRARAAEASRSRTPQVTQSPVASLPPMGRSVQAPAISAAEMGSPEALRRAFILKTILDKPVSMRPPGERS